MSRQRAGHLNLVATDIRYLSGVHGLNPPIIEDSQTIERPPVVDAAVNDDIILAILLCIALPLSNFKNNMTVIEQIEIYTSLLESFEEQFLFCPHPVIKYPDFHIIRPNPRLLLALVLGLTDQW